MFPPPGMIRLTVQTLMGQSHQVIMEKEDTVNDLKEEIYFKTSIAPDMQSLLFLNQPLDEDRSLASYNIQDGSTIKLIVEVESGFNIVR